MVCKIKKHIFGLIIFKIRITKQKSTPCYMTISNMVYCTTITYFFAIYYLFPIIYFIALILVMMILIMKKKNREHRE